MAGAHRLVTVSVLVGTALAPLGAEPLSYPPARRGEQVDVLHGTPVPDPYRWLEDPDSPETRAWVDAQNRVTGQYLDQIPERSRLRERLTQLWNYERVGLPFREGKNYFFTRNTGLQNQSVLLTARSLDAEPRVLLDPNTLSPDGTVSTSGYTPSRDGRLLAYSVQKAGSDWIEWRVRDVATARDLPDRLQWSKFGGLAWTRDGRGFFYTRYETPKSGEELRQQNRFPRVCYHRLGDPQEKDAVVYHRPDQPDWGFGVTVTEDGRYLVLHVSQGSASHNRLFYKDLKHPRRPLVGADDSPVVELVPEADASYGFVDSTGPRFWIQTDLDAPRSRVVEIDLARPARKDWRTLIPEAPEALRFVGTVGDRFVAGYLKDAYTVVRQFSLAGKDLGELELPGIGTAGGFGGHRKDEETFFTFTTFTRPGTVYRYDFRRGSRTVFHQPQLPVDAGSFETRQVFYRSKDGTRVPMFLTHRKGLRLDGSHPTYLSGYGGFRSTLTPAYSPVYLAWLEMGGVVAVANLRGGGEYGREWHQAGTKLRKQNVFDDFIAAAEWLIGNGYTRREQLAIAGGSNGGLLVGAAMTQRPDLFGAALPDVGVLDMLRFHRFTIGWAWTPDYGSPDVPEEFRALRAYSPYHNLRPGTAYPATLVTTADHDDRVVPAHSFKFAAALQAAHSGPAPVLIRVDTNVGHGGGMPTAKRIQKAADQLAFLVKNLGVAPSEARR